jgi:hypothetical protein
MLNISAMQHYQCAYAQLLCLINRHVAFLACYCLLASHYLNMLQTKPLGSAVQQLPAQQ